MSTALKIISEVMGIVCTLAWSVSFYFMAWEVIKVKNADGLSINYLMLNFIGYTYYSVYNVYGFTYDPPYNNGQIHTSDIIFSVHGLFLTSLHIVLVLYYPRFDNKPKTVWVVCAIMSILFVAGYSFVNPNIQDIVLTMGIMKVVISFIKYVPQVYLNWFRKSTYGFSIHNILLDFTGGLLTFLQIPVDFYASGTKPKLDSNLNLAKFLLGFITVFFDFVFLIQHYCIYPSNIAQKHDPRYGRETEGNQDTNYYRITNPAPEIEEIEESSDQDDYRKKVVD